METAALPNPFAPDVVSVGSAGRLVTVRAIAREFGCTENRAHLLLEALSIPLLQVGAADGPYVSLWALERALIRFWCPDMTDDEIQRLGAHYKSLTREGVRNHIDVVLRKARTARRAASSSLRTKTPSDANPNRVSDPPPVAPVPAPPPPPTEGPLPIPRDTVPVQIHRGMEQPVARRVHDPEVVGSSPTPASPTPFLSAFTRFGGKQ